MTALGAIVGSGLLEGCTKASPAPAPEISADGDIDPHLGDLRKALASSPDLLRARADEAVASGDPNVIARFVREHIGVLPPLPAEIPVASIRFGARGALRAGAGSFRDRVELLAELLTAAGFTTTIVRASRQGWGSEVYAAPVHPFQPDSTMMASVGAAVGVTVPSTFTDDSDATTRVNASVTRILSALPTDQRTATAKAGGLPDDVPVVEFTRAGGSKRWAIALGSTDVSDAEPAGAAPAGSPLVPNVKIAVSVALRPPAGAVIDRTALFEVVAGEWPVDQVVGRCVSLSFAPPVPPEQALGYDLTSFPVRTPVLRLYSLESLGASVVDTYGGLAVSLNGGIYGPSTADPKQIVGPYGPVPTPLDSAARAEARARAAMVRVTANPASFPGLDLDVAVLDASDNVIEGLGSDDFAVSEDDSSVDATIIANVQPPAVRVVVFYDTSGSVLDFWPSADAKAKFETALAAALVSAASSAPFVVQVIALGSKPSADWRAPNASDVTAALTAAQSDSSVWQSVGQVLPDSGACAAILVSDCVSALEDPAQIPGFKKAMAAARIPVAVVPIGKPDDAAVEAIVSGSGGVRLDPADPGIGSALTDFVRQQVATRLSNAYRLRYEAPLAGPVTRSVKVAIKDHAQVTGSTTYQVPAEADRTAPSGVAGIYLSVTANGVTDVRRLAGVELTSSLRLYGDPSAADIAQCTQALNSVTDVVLDAPGSTNAQRLDDALAALLTLGPLRRSSPSDTKGIVAAAQDIRKMPWLAAALGEPVAAAGGVTPPGLWVRVIGTVPTATGLSLDSDLAPALTQMIGTSADPAEAFRAALQATAGASVRESQWMASSAAALLAEQSLVVAQNADGLPTWSDATKAAFRPLLMRYDSYVRLVPATGAVTALWLVDPRTGSATAVSADGHGGGSSHCKLAAPSDLAGWLSAALTVVGLACTATGPGSEAAPNTTPYACVQANVYAVGVLAYGSFTNPVSLLSLSGVTGVLGTAFGFAPTIPSVAGKAVSIFLQLMLAALGQITCE
ncbi:MAG: hypothetical protein HY898_28630 [Deltaproteobacteria bacterium]|nr:hypothetical protein [Deltaproteobacteria bacterium]